MKKRLFTLIGYPLSHSFSRKYFSQKFEKEGINDHEYTFSPLEKIEDFPLLLSKHPDLVGINVTIPYKEQVIPYLDEISEEAEAIGAVNTIKVTDGKLKGFNTDVYGFEYSLLDFFKEKKEGYLPPQALVLGTGGAAKAVIFVLKKLGIPYLVVSRDQEKGDLIYDEIDDQHVLDFPLIINTTPLGMSPKVDTFPTLPYEQMTVDNFLYDLVYNPEKTVFLNKGKKQNAFVKNGHEMLILQAEKAWKIWNSKTT